MSKYTVTFNGVDGEQIGDLLAMVNENNRKYGRPKIPTPAITIEGEVAPMLGVAESGDMHIKTNVDVRKAAPFWMVYRDGGGPPEHKHADVVSASKEADRLARMTGCKTYVLAVEEEHDPHRMPTWAEVGAHAKAWPANLFHEGCGLWRVVESGKVPAIVGVKQDNVRISCTANGHNWMSEEDMAILRVNAAWFPLDANGKDINSDDIPF